MRFLIPKQLREHGLAKSQLAITPRALRAIVDGYAANLEDVLKAAFAGGSKATPA